MPTYAVFIVIALGTIVVGLTLGGVSVPQDPCNMKWRCGRGRERGGRGGMVGGRERERERGRMEGERERGMGW